MGVASAFHRKEVLKVQVGELPRFAEDHYAEGAMEKRKAEQLVRQVEQARTETELAQKEADRHEEERKKLETEMNEMARDVATKARTNQDQLNAYKTRAMYLAEELDSVKTKQVEMKREVSNMRRTAEETRENQTWEHDKALKALQLSKKKEADMKTELQNLPGKVKQELQKKLQQMEGTSLTEDERQNLVDGIINQVAQKNQQHLQVCRILITRITSL